MKKIKFLFFMALFLSCFFFSQSALKDIVTVHIAFDESSGNMDDLELVIAKINESLRETLNIELAIDFISFGDNSMMEYLLKNPDADLICVSHIKENATRGLLLPLDDLLEEEGQQILSSLSEEYLDLGKIEGTQYSLIRKIDMAQSIGICMRKDLINKYQIDLSSIKTWDDYEKVLKIVTEGENNSSSDTVLYGIVPDLLNPFDTLGDNLGVLMSDEIPMKIVNYYETSEFREWITRVKKWGDLGYLYTKKDLHYTNVSAKPFLYQLMKEGMLFSYMVKYKPGIAIQESKLCETELVSIRMENPVMTTATASMKQWAIYSGSSHPKEAMRVLNLLYSDPEIINLLSWGIEGMHYEKNSDGTISYPQGKSESEIGYHFTAKWLLPDPYLAYVWEGDSLTLKADVKTFNDSAIRSPALGFSFDSSFVSVSYEKNLQIVEAYLSGFLCGAFDIDVMLPKMIQDLKENGIEDIILEKQRQLDEWYASMQ